MSRHCFLIIGFYYLKVLSIITPELCIIEMHRAATHKVLKVKKGKLDELHIRMRNYKMPKMVEGQSVDYVAIHATKRSLSQYPLGM
jgi:hypothetical protein